ncbi:chemotaxis protein CheW [Poseidonibacter parvus]|uniref:Chemotaxis protein CheW n=1 Tax=Poseidonibacter parvus TaxID=1850254 RepID=A0A1P8KKU8_9BACT|nr:chemotaxis protein CheW [Poseidonibacter parvus]APW65182.1 chemotaxis protein CheW [Poseidonibacter parvus]
MDNSLINYKGINIKKDLYPIIKYIEDVDKYREELGRLSSSWDVLALLGQLGDINIDIEKIKGNFLNLTSTLLNHLSEQQIDKVRHEMRFKAQVAIDIVIRNLFERTADIGFLATDDDIRYFLKNYVSKYDDKSNELSLNMIERFKEYVEKYSVYFDIVLADTKGNILVRLDDSTDVKKISSKQVEKILNTSEDYVETYKFHHFLPQYKKSLVYSYKVTENNSPNSKNIGILSLCFKFTGEMNDIFNNLIDESNKECLTILDEEGFVIASSDKNHIPLNAQLPIIINEEYKLISFAGRDYIAKSCDTNGYQGFMGLKWYGHIMIPLEHAFLSDVLNDIKYEPSVIDAMISNKDHFSKDLKDVFNKSNSIQDNLKRIIWNGNIAQSKYNSVNRDFSKSLLTEIGLTGTKANASLSNLNQTIISSILKNSEFLSSLAIDIMDRNLYERANDCRWWALTSYFREALENIENINTKKDELSSILKYINDLYTVYTNIFIFDKNGKVIAVSNKEEEYLLGKIINTKWVEDTFTLKDTSKYCVSNFEKTNLYNNESTYIYSSAIRSIKNSSNIIGGIALVFDSTPELYTMLADTLPKHSDGKKVNGIFAVFTNRNKEIISTTNKSLEIGSLLNLEDDFFSINNGTQKSKIVKIADTYFAIGVKCSSGYREYKSEADDYKNDILSFTFIKIGEDKNNNTSTTINKYINNINKKKTGNSVELATFNIGSKFLAVKAKCVIESIGIDDLQSSIEMDKTNHFKGMVIYKEKLIAVLDIRDFINEEITDDELKDIILLEYDKDNIDHCVGILVSSLEHSSLVEEKSIQHIQNHFLGSGTLIESLVDIDEYEKSKVAMLLNIQKLDENLTKKI